MKEYKGTKGDFKVHKVNDYNKLGVPTNEVYIVGEWIAQVRGDNDEIREANAETIATGLNLAQKYGSLQELERQRSELFDALEEIVRSMELLILPKDRAKSTKYQKAITALNNAKI